MNVPATPTPTARGRAFRLLALVLVVIALGWTSYWYVALRGIESTDDAYVQGDVMTVTAEVAGTVRAVHVAETARVHRGDVLVELDDRDARLALDTALAELDRVVRDVNARQLQLAQNEANVAVRRVALERARADLARRRDLDRDGIVSGEDLAHAGDSVAEQEAALRVADAQRGAIGAELRGAGIDSQPRVAAAVAAVRSAALAVARTRILAPDDGIVARKAVQVGQRIAAGTPLLAVADVDHVWVDANFKEVQLGRLQPGLPVELRADLYGNDVRFHGVIVGMSAGSGSAFALLPAQNASGNWIKVVQRLPVRIAINAADLTAHPLRIGLSTTVQVDTAARPATDAVLGHERHADLASSDPAVEAQITAILTAGRHTAKQSARRTHRPS